MSAFSARMGILPEAQRNIWPDLRVVSDIGFTLYGGTAIALRFGHRESVDFDFFSDIPFEPDALVQRVPLLERARPLQVGTNTYTAIVTDDRTGSRVKLSFFGGLRIGRINNPSWTQDGVLRVADPLDLLATKLKVILQRVEAKDYIDVATLTREGVSLTEGLAAASAFYPQTFPPQQCIKTLTYFGDGDLGAVPQADRDHLVEVTRAVRDIPVFARCSDSLGSDVPRPSETPEP